MFRSVAFEKLKNPAGPTEWEIVRLGESRPERYETLDDALTYARLCYDGDRDSVFVREVLKNA